MLTVSDTAYAIAAIRAMESSLPVTARLFDDPWAAVFAAAGAHAAEGTARFVALPFFCDGIRLRTRYFDDVVRDALAAGVAQVVILGVGFDARGARLPEVVAHGAKVYEVDLAPLLDARREILAAAGVASPPHVAAVPCDLAVPDLHRELSAALVAAGFRDDRPALYLCEGLFSYLSADVVARVLRFMATHGAPGTRAAFDYGDGYLWPDSLPDLARRSGFDDVDEVSYDALWRRHLAGDPHEAAVVCRAAVVVRRA